MPLLTACPSPSHPRGKGPTRGTSEIRMLQTAQAHWLDTLVEHPVPISLGRGPSFVPTFVWTHRTFATSQQVLGYLQGEHPAPHSAVVFQPPAGCESSGHRISESVLLCTAGGPRTSLTESLWGLRGSSL